ncbi:hypothetical protein OPV22_006459 [Ensete ventricosum]|uniref:RING-type domain-containing protein n=1 Tax=Ensete ventricosum TaxID=4639 RepID=A0A426ZH84_ENSVE|nr:hypothetical protein OPV22_006459 [Ensete ventricosum]RRT63335.1 hypothetical protein B296_00019882 [Ensete ventricosum]
MVSWKEMTRMPEASELCAWRASRWAMSAGCFLQCKHAFHAKCVDAWLVQMPTYPTCRTSAMAGKVLSCSKHLSWVHSKCRRCVKTVNLE